jgi:phosphinothricin acetyltransferase
MIRSATPSDAEAICNIYNYYVLNTHNNFEEEAVSVPEMEDRIRTVLEKHFWLVFESEGKIAGYAYAGAWKSRCSYRYSVETTVYVAQGHLGKGIGSKLYDALLAKLHDTDVHAVIGGIALPNEESIALHEKFGFEKIAQFREVGYKFNKWIDVGYWEKLIS